MEDRSFGRSAKDLKEVLGSLSYLVSDMLAAEQKITAINIVFKEPYWSYKLTCNGPELKSDYHGIHFVKA